MCRTLGIARKEDDGKPIGHRLLEHALVRMAAIAIVDVETRPHRGARRRALAVHARGIRRAGPLARNATARMPYPIRYSPDALLNPAVYHDAMPASTIKPVMAAAFLSDPAVGTKWLAAERAEMQRTPWPTRDSLRGQLMRSDSARFLDRMFCIDRKPSPIAAGLGKCRRRRLPSDGTSTARTMPAKAAASATCCSAHRRSALRRSPIVPSPFGRLMVEPASDAPGAPMRVARQVPLDAAKVARCAAGPDGRRGTKDDWEKCRARRIVDVAAEGWGQGNARATALGAAGMMASLAAAANGDAPRSIPHLVALGARAGAAPTPSSCQCGTAAAIRISRARSRKSS